MATFAKMRGQMFGDLNGLPTVPQQGTRETGTRAWFSLS